MAAHVQRKLDFAVRKNSRKQRICCNETKVEFDSGDLVSSGIQKSTPRRSARKHAEQASIKKVADPTLHKYDQIYSKQNENGSVILTPESKKDSTRSLCEVEDVTSLTRSPLKRKPVSASCIPTPSKSPCKSPGRREVLPNLCKENVHFQNKTGSCYQAAKQSLHTSRPDHLVGRDQEVTEIAGFLKLHLGYQTSGSMYISGAPGTGKTAALLHIIDDFKSQYKCHIGYLNCMVLKDVSSVLSRLHSELSGRSTAGKITTRDMEKLITSSKQSMILVLDEIDQLDSKSQEILYCIFEWPALENSKLILIGIANALDLTDRILPRLQAKPKCRPKLLHFAPYTHDQIAAIIQERLSQGADGIVESSAVQFCARKVSAVAGDARKALDVCRRAVELAESERSKIVLRTFDTNSPSKRHASSVQKITVTHINKVMCDVYGTSVQVQQSEGVPLQQKLVVCTLLLSVQGGRFKEIQLGKLHENYCKVCRRQLMIPVDQSEFFSLCVLLEARGIIAIKKAKETRLCKLTLRQDEKELEETLQDKVLVSTILREGLPK